jgi:hypothetical protein
LECLNSQTSECIWAFQNFLPLVLRALSYFTEVSLVDMAFVPKTD